MSQTKVQLINNVSGDSGFGTSSPAEKLVVNGAIVASGAVSNPSSYTDTGLYIQNKGSSIFDIAAWRSGASVSEISFSTDSGSDAAPVERMRLDKDGNLGIGTTSPASTLSVEQSSSNICADLHATGSGRGSQIKIHNDHGEAFVGQAGDTTGDFIVYNGSNSNMLFYTNGSERMRIDSSGDLKVQRIYDNITSGGANVRVQSNGLMQRDTSSRRYKNTIADATHGLADLNKLRPVTYKGNNDGDTIFGGLIAEEVHDAGLTEFVDYNSDNEPDALRYGNMVSLCIKAIQELSAKVEALEAK